MPETKAEDLTPTPTQAENDAAMLAACGQTAPAAGDVKAEKAEEAKPAQPAARTEARR